MNYNYWLLFQCCWWGLEEEAVANCSKRDFSLICITFDSNWWYFITADLLMNPQAHLHLCSFCGFRVMLQIMSNRKSFIKWPLMNYQTWKENIIQTKICQKMIEMIVEMKKKKKKTLSKKKELIFTPLAHEGFYIFKRRY